MVALSSSFGYRVGGFILSAVVPCAVAFSVSKISQLFYETFLRRQKTDRSTAITQYIGYSAGLMTTFLLSQYLTLKAIAAMPHAHPYQLDSDQAMRYFCGLLGSTPVLL